MWRYCLSSVRKSITGKSTPACRSDKHTLVTAGCFWALGWEIQKQNLPVSHGFYELSLSCFPLKATLLVLCGHAARRAFLLSFPKCLLNATWWIITSPQKKNPHLEISDWLFLSNGSLATSQSLGIDSYRTFEPGMFKIELLQISGALLNADLTKSHLKRISGPRFQIHASFAYFCYYFQALNMMNQLQFGINRLHSDFFTHNPLLNNLLWLLRWDGWKQKKPGRKQIFFMWNKKGLQLERGAGVGDTADTGSERRHEEGEQV